MILFRIDVDYPYPSRFTSFLYTTLGIKLSSDYLLNSKIVARMINETSEPVKAFWFFTVKTIPDEKLLRLLNKGKHEVSLHVVNDPSGELKTMEAATQSKIHYYTIHGTARFLARLMWRRKGREADIPKDFPLKDFTKMPTPSFPLDSMCYYQPVDNVINEVRKQAGTDFVLYFHPIWLFQRGKINHRGPFYEALRTILEVDKELKTLEIRKKAFFKIARDGKEYEKNIVPTTEFLEKLKEGGVDIFTFLERRWCYTVTNVTKTWVKANDNIGLLQITSYDEWLRSIGKKTRNMIRKAEKCGIRTAVTEPDEKLAEGIWRIYNETPIRQEREFPHYGTPLEAVRRSVLSPQNSTFVAAFLQDDLVGFIQLVHGDNIAIISQILSMQKHWDKAVNNALVAKAVETCAGKGIKWLMYGRMGNHPTLDTFKINNGVVKFNLTRYYIPLTKKGRIAAHLGMHKEIKDSLPQSIKYPLIPVYNWISRTRTRIRVR